MLSAKLGKPTHSMGGFSSMMTVLRYLLLIVTAICFVSLNYELWKDHHNVPWFVYGIWISLVLNFAYLTASAPKGQTWRLFGLVGLWLDAKESELRARAKRENSPPQSN
jgi:hypothetical protein